MTLAVSLQISGDAKGAVRAAEDATLSLIQLAKSSGLVTREMEDGFKRAQGAIGHTAESAKAFGGANDNIASSSGVLVGKLVEIAAGADSAFGKVAAGAAGVARGILDIVKVASPIGLITAGLGLATTAVGVFYSLINSGEATAARTLQEHARLLGVVKGAYQDATNKAGEFLTQSRAVLQLQTGQNLIALRAQQQNQLRAAAAALTYETGESTPFGVIGGRGREARTTYSELGAEIKKFAADVAAGKVDVKQFADSLATAGNNAAESNPKLAQQANAARGVVQGAIDTTNAIKQEEAWLRVLKGTATDADRAVVGLANNGTAAFENMLKSLERQSAAQEAEAAAVGKSAGQAARLRGEFVLLEAAQQSGTDASVKYADKIAAIADRYGAAAQKVVEFKLRSDTAFERSQIGRDPTEAAVADRLRSVYGDNFESQFNGIDAATIRLNENLKIAKGEATEFASSMAKGWAAGANAIDTLNGALGRVRDAPIDGIRIGFCFFQGEDPCQRSM